MSADDSNSCLHLVVESRITPLLFFPETRLTGRQDDITCGTGC